MDEWIKLMVVGGGGVGKTCLLITYTEEKFPSEYVPKIIGGNVVEVKIAETTYQLQLWDTVTNSVDNSVSQEQ